MHKENDVKQATLDNFDGDELAANVFMTKYCLKNKKGEYMEKTPDDMHRRLAKEFARVERKFSAEGLSEEEIYNLFKGFKYVVPQGSPMKGIGLSLIHI